jgi:hypothetical protein
MKTCSIDGCTGKFVARGLCDRHYRRLRRHGDPTIITLNLDHDGTCSIDGCTKAYIARGLCGMHYRRRRVDGSVGPAESRRPTIGSGCRRSDGYVIVQAPGHPLNRAKGTYLHRVVLFDEIGLGPHRCHWCSVPVAWTHGLGVGALVADHLDHDTTNNAPSNLVPSCNPCNSQRRAAA